MKKKLRRTLATALSVFLVAGVVLPVEANAQRAEDIDPGALSYAYGGQLGLVLLDGLPLTNGIDVAELPGTKQNWVKGSSNPQEPETQTLDVAALNNLVNLDLGQLDLPLVGQNGLIEFVLSDAELGAVLEYANAHTPNEAYGAVGLVGSDGSTVDLTEGESGNPYARVDLISLLRLRESPGFTNNVISDASLALGVLGAKAERPDTEVDKIAECIDGLSNVTYGDLRHDNLSDQYFVISSELEDEPYEDNGKFCSDYRIADAKIIIDAPLVKDFIDAVENDVRNIQTLLDAILLAPGALNGVLDEITPILQNAIDLLFLLYPGKAPEAADILRLSVTAEIPLNTIIDDLLEPLQDQNELVLINLKEGQIEIDLQKLHEKDLSKLSPNTPLITGDNISSITETVVSLLTAPKDGVNGNPDGLMARLDTVLRGTKGPDGVHRGGLYGTQVAIDLSLLDTRIEVLPATPLTPAVTVDLGGSINVQSTLGALLNPDNERTKSKSTLDSDPYRYYLYETNGLILTVLGTALVPLLAELTGEVGDVVDKTLFDEHTGLLANLLGGIQHLALFDEILDFLDPALIQLLNPLLGVIVNRQTVHALPQGNLFTVSALELNVLPLGVDLETPADEASLLRLPLATAAVMAQSWNLIDLDFNVAKIGTGRNLHTGGYTYELICEADRWTGIDAIDEVALDYPGSGVGTGYSFTANSLDLNNAGGGLTEPIKVIPGALCTLSPTQPLEDYISSDKRFGLRPTGDNPTRTPYTYFLSPGESEVEVSGVVTDGITSWTPTGIIDGPVTINPGSVRDEWKDHTLIFRIPDDATSHTVNIVHAYDIDTRDIIVKKIVEGPAEPNTGFEFDYSIHNGSDWMEIPGGVIGHGQERTISVPLLDAALEPTELQVREHLPVSSPDVPEVSWVLDDPDETEPNDSRTSDFAAASFTAGLGITAATSETLPLTLTVTNSYPVEIDFVGMLPATGVTTLVWVLALGLIAALAALALYVRSGRK